MSRNGNRDRLRTIDDERRAWNSQEEGKNNKTGMMELEME